MLKCVNKYLPSSSAGANMFPVWFDDIWELCKLGKMIHHTSWNCEKNIGDFEWVVHGSKWSFICIGYKSFDLGWLIKALEGESIKVGLSSLLQFRDLKLSQPFIVESNLINVVHLLIKFSTDISYMKNVIEVVLDVTSWMHVIYFVKYNHYCNFVAYSLVWAVLHEQRLFIIQKLMTPTQI